MEDLLSLLEDLDGEVVSTFALIVGDGVEMGDHPAELLSQGSVLLSLEEYATLASLFILVFGYVRLSNDSLLHGTPCLTLYIHKLQNILLLEVSPAHIELFQSCPNNRLFSENLESLHKTLYFGVE